jgi:site-specific DNA-cytosine methylase
VCDELEAAGYEVWPVVVGADHVGAPHRRHRVWIVARRVGHADEPRADAQSARRGSRQAVGESGCELAHGDEHGQPEQRSGWVLDGERAASGADADRRGERPVGEPTGSGLALRRACPEPARAEQPEHPRASCWPARPGEPHHEWEAPRLAHSERGRRHGREESAGGQHDHGSSAGRVQGECRPSDGNRRAGGPAARKPESGVGLATDGLSDYVAGRITSRHRREALKALGNGVVPACAQAIGRAILAAEASLT